MSPVRPIGDADRGWLAALIRERWAGDIVVVHGATYRPATLAGFVATADGAPVGALTYVVDGEACEIVTIDALHGREGIGSALLAAAEREARDAGCARLWLITTHGNEDALAFYRARGFTVTAIHRGAVDAARVLKPSIPLTDPRGVPIRDEIELARDLR